MLQIPCFNGQLHRLLYLPLALLTAINIQYQAVHNKQYLSDTMLTISDKEVHTPSMKKAFPFVNEVLFNKTDCIVPIILFLKPIS